MSVYFYLSWCRPWLCLLFLHGHWNWWSAGIQLPGLENWPSRFIVLHRILQAMRLFQLKIICIQLFWCFSFVWWQNGWFCVISFGNISGKMCFGLSELRWWFFAEKMGFICILLLQQWFLYRWVYIKWRVQRIRQILANRKQIKGKKVQHGSSGCVQLAENGLWCACRLFWYLLWKELLHRFIMWKRILRRKCFRCRFSRQRAM